MRAEVLANISPPTIQISRHTNRETEAYKYFHQSESTGSPLDSEVKLPAITKNHLQSMLLTPRI